MKIIIQLEEGYSINEILSQLPKIETIKDEQSVEIEIIYNCGDFLKGEIFAVIVAYVRWLESLGKQVNIVCDTSEDCNTVRYAARIDFFNLLGIPFEEKFNRKNSEGRFIEITPFEEENLWDIVHQTIKIFKNTLNINSTVLDCIYYCFGEVVGNVDTHSQSKSGGIIYAQHFPKGNGLKIFIIDSGVGFYESLASADKYKELNHEEALRKCLEKEVTNGKGKGMGLYYTSSFTVANKGILSINSCGKKLQKANDAEIICDVPYWQGSIISMELKTNEIVSYEEIFESHKPLTFDELEESRNEKDNQIDDLW